MSSPATPCARTRACTHAHVRCAVWTPGRVVHIRGGAREVQALLDSTPNDTVMALHWCVPARVLAPWHVHALCVWACVCVSAFWSWFT